MFLRLFQPVCATLALLRYVSTSFTLTTMAVGNTSEGFASVLLSWSLYHRGHAAAIFSSKVNTVHCRCTRENEHPRKRAPDHTTPAYSDMEAKFFSQTQPQKCAPTANLDTQLTAFCTRSAFCTRWSKPVAEF